MRGRRRHSAGGMAEHLKPDDVAHMPAEMLAGAVGRTEAKWLELIGPVESLPIWSNVQSNWRVSPHHG